ncbi:MAG: histidine kinase, partial [bacterium]|nr:histidine kinase [bacterium]
MEQGIEKNMRKSRTAIILIILTIMALPGNIFAQKNNIRFQHLSLEHDLSQASVLCILQDSQGFMWFGTQDGLNKYDGYRFTVYRHNPGDRASLSANYIWSIFEDSTGNLWIGTNGGGLNQFDRSSDTFTRYQNQADNPHSLSHNSVYSIFED